MIGPRDLLPGSPIVQHFAGDPLADLPRIRPSRRVEPPSGSGEGGGPT
ncbi:hypothetical protein [Saccharothrix hoggarensis]|uniref:Uncharacterized protein n=1 Tax=Saccharothrix hoggarensis TaxID=913853 RepID=A0ABW3QPC1_9PSEU